MQVTAKSNIKHDGQKFTAGQSLDVTEEQAAALLAAGVIEPVKGLKPAEPEEAPDKSVGTPDDKNAEREGVEEVANLPVNKKMNKEKLRGIALAMGIEVEKTATKDEIYDLIVEKRGGSTESEETEEDETDKANADVTAGDDVEADEETEDAPEAPVK